MVSKTKDDSYYFLLTISFFLFALIGVFNHEMWRDEADPWLLARDSNSFLDLFLNKRYLGHPSLWYISLFLLTKLSHNVILMQLLHLSIAVIIVYLFVYFAPFSKIQKTLFCFGYFPFYEYAIISRNYNLGILFMFLFCIFFSIQKRNYFYLFLILTFMANVNVYSSIISICLMLTLMLEALLDKEKFDIVLKNKISILLGISIFLIGIGYAIIDMIPPPDCSIATSFVNYFDKNLFYETGLKLFYSYVPIPNFGSPSFWETTILNYRSFPYSFSVGICLAVFFWLFSLFTFSKQPLSFFLYFFGSIIIFLFMYIKSDYGAHMRHLGHFFFLFIVCIWIAENIKDMEKNILIFDQTSNLCIKYRNKFILIIFIMQCIGGIFAFASDVELPFSKAKQTAEYIKLNHLDKLLIVGSPDFSASSIAAYLDEKIYYPESHRFGSHIIWDGYRKWNVSLDEIFFDINKLINSYNKDLLLILNYALSEESINLYREKLESGTGKRIVILKIKDFTNCIIMDEIYYLYIIKIYG